MLRSQVHARAILLRSIKRHVPGRIKCRGQGFQVGYPRVQGWSTWELRIRGAQGICKDYIEIRGSLFRIVGDLCR